MNLSKVRIKNRSSLLKGFCKTSGLEYLQNVLKNVCDQDFFCKVANYKVLFNRKLVNGWSSRDWRPSQPLSNPLALVLWHDFVMYVRTTEYLHFEISREANLCFWYAARWIFFSKWAGRYSNTFFILLEHP